MDQNINKGQIYYIWNMVNEKEYVGQAVMFCNKQDNLINFGYKKRFEEHMQYNKNKK